MHFLFPSDTFDPQQPDEMFADQIRALESVGFAHSLFSSENAQAGKSALHGELPADETVVYRGWMLTQPQYKLLVNSIESANAAPLVSVDVYLLTHHLPNWYPLIREYTPETRIFAPSADLEDELAKLGWDGFFIKDYVKSLKTSLGSAIRDPKDVHAVVTEMKAFRGEIEGGICVRRIETFKPETETRYFVIMGVPYASSATSPIPEIVSTCARRISSPFFSVDVAERSDGQLRIVEIGDGQVSDIVGWPADRLARIWEETLSSPHRGGNT